MSQARRGRKGALLPSLAVTVCRGGGAASGCAGRPAVELLHQLEGELVVGRQLVGVLAVSVRLLAGQRSAGGVGGEVGALVSGGGGGGA